jgi:hypothetical protein
MIFSENRHPLFGIMLHRLPLYPMAVLTESRRLAYEVIYPVVI